MFTLFEDKFRGTRRQLTTGYSILLTAWLCFGDQSVGEIGLGPIASRLEKLASGLGPVAMLLALTFVAATVGGFVDRLFVERLSQSASKHLLGFRWQDLAGLTGDEDSVEVLFRYRSEAELRLGMAFTVSWPLTAIALQAGGFWWLTASIPALLVVDCMLLGSDAVRATIAHFETDISKLQVQQAALSTKLASGEKTLVDLESEIATQDVAAAPHRQTLNEDSLDQTAVKAEISQVDAQIEQVRKRVRGLQNARTFGRSR